MLCCWTPLTTLLCTTFPEFQTKLSEEHIPPLSPSVECAANRGPRKFSTPISRHALHFTLGCATILVFWLCWAARAQKHIFFCSLQRPLSRENDCWAPELPRATAVETDTMGRPSLACRNQQHERPTSRGAREEGSVRGAHTAAAAAAVAAAAGGLLPQRRPRQGTAAAAEQARPFAQASARRGAAGDASAAGGDRAGGGRAAAAARRRPGGGCSRLASTRLPPLTACSLAVLAFLGLDPAAAFQVCERAAVRRLPGWHASVLGRALTAVALVGRGRIGTRLSCSPPVSLFLVAYCYGGPPPMWYGERVWCAWRTHVELNMCDREPRVLERAAQLAARKGALSVQLPVLLPLRSLEPQEKKLLRSRCLLTTLFFFACFSFLDTRIAHPANSSSSLWRCRHRPGGTSSSKRFASCEGSCTRRPRRVGAATTPRSCREALPGAWADR